ncbi:MAG TPA: 1-phosphofructokinase family hexose kinase [Rhodanobacteraceae bacterium]
MIAVAGFNTAIDRRVDVDVLQPGEVQRARAVAVEPGGKGLHVAQVAAVLGEEAALVGLTDAANEGLLQAHLNARGVNWHGVHQAGGLRQCLAIREADGRMTEILESGEALSRAQCDALIGEVESLIPTSNALVLSGSLPHGCDVNTYADLVRTASACGVKSLLDASGETLRACLAAQPWLVKPNVDEAAALWGRTVNNIDDAVECAAWLHGRGIGWAVVTLGAQGAVGFDGTHAWHAHVEVKNVRNVVGSGDCFMAGLAVACARGWTLDDALRLASACGAANAQGEETGYVDMDVVAALLENVELQRLGG